MPFRSIRWRLVASYVLLALLAVTLVGVLALTLVRQSVEARELDSLRANAEAVARQAQLLCSPPRPLELSQLAHAAAFLGNARVRILDAQQQPMADSGPRNRTGEMALMGSSGDLLDSGEDSVLPPPFMVLAYDESRWRSSWRGRHSENYTLVWRVEGPWGSQLAFATGRGQDEPAAVATPTTQASMRSTQVVTVPIDGPVGAIGYVELSGGPDFGAEALATTQNAFVVAGLGAGLIAAVVGLVVGRGLTAPLNTLTAATTRMSSGDLSARAPVHSTDEIGQLAAQFNQMAAHLEASFAQLSAERDTLRRFIADASHELRTPITALRNFIDLMQGAAANDAAARAEFLVESQKQLTRLEWITSNLLDLSRLEAGLAALHLARHDVRELTNEVIAAFRPQAQDKGIALNVQLPPAPHEVQCDRARLEMALSNLIDNALKFTPSGGRVDVSAEVEGAVARWRVQDTGPGIGPADQPHIFERFYRGAHPGRPGVEGSGLGLAIVHSIVQAHGGRTWVESQPRHGSRFVVELPLNGAGR
jgi:signal transduction histidine kinase